MGKQAPMGFTGRLGHLIYYEMNGAYYVRTAPDKVRQTEATRARATEFGRASSIGKEIRKLLLPVIPDPDDHKMQTRLVSAVFKCLRGGRDPQKEPAGNLSFLSGFSFTDSLRSLGKWWSVSLQVSNPSAGLLQVKIPEFIPKESIVAPARTVSVTCHIAVAVLDAATGKAAGAASTELTFHYNRVPVAAQTLSMELPTPKGSLMITGLSLKYMIPKNNDIVYSTNKAFMPAGIVTAIYL